MIGLTVDIVVYYIALKFSVPYLYGNAFSHLCGSTVSFILNLYLTFDVKDKIVLRYIMMTAVSLLGLVGSSTSLLVLIYTLEVNEFLAKIIALPIVVFIQYALNKQLTFRKFF